MVDDLMPKPRKSFLYEFRNATSMFLSVKIHFRYHTFLLLEKTALSIMDANTAKPLTMKDIASNRGIK